MYFSRLGSSLSPFQTQAILDLTTSDGVSFHDAKSDLETYWLNRMFASQFSTTLPLRGPGVT